MAKCQKVQIFSALSESQCEEIEGLIHWFEVPKGSVLISRGDDSLDVYFISSGKCRSTSYSFKGREISYEDLGPGDTFGELSAIDAEPRTTGIIALSDSLLGRLSASDFWQLLLDYPEVMQAVMRRMSAMNRSLIIRLFDIAAMTVPNRVRAALVRLGRKNLIAENTALIENPPTHEEIANFIATHREAVTKELNQLAKDGYIEKEGRQIRIPDLIALEQLIEEQL